MKVVIGILLVAVAGILWALYDVRRRARDRQQEDEMVIVDFSNRWAQTQVSLEEQLRVNRVLETNLTERRQDIDLLKVDVSSLNLALAKSLAETRTAQDEIAKRDQQIATLEGRNDDLTRQINGLQNELTSLEQQIAETERKLAASEGNLATSERHRQVLLTELKRLQGEKLALQKQLNDLAFVREQVRKLKDELSIARRLDWIRRGLYGATTRRGAELVTQMKFGSNAAARTSPGYGLDVDLKRSGEVQIRSQATNPPAVQRQ